MKKVILTLAVIITAITSYAQVDSVRLEQDKIFQYINKSLIPTGYLNEYGPEAIEKKWLNGVLSDSNRIINIDMYNFLYNDIANSRLNTAVPAMNDIDSIVPYLDLAAWDTVMCPWVSNIFYMILAK